MGVIAVIICWAIGHRYRLWHVSRWGKCYRCLRCGAFREPL